MIDKDKLEIEIEDILIKNFGNYQLKVPCVQEIISLCHRVRDEALEEARIRALALCYAIEALPASEQQTKISIMASDLHRALRSKGRKP